MGAKLSKETKEENVGLTSSAEREATRVGLKAGVSRGLLRGYHQELLPTSKCTEAA